jgi:hypothetical protein
VSKVHKCKQCKGEYVKFQSTQKVCSNKCALALAKSVVAKIKDKEHNKRKRKLKDEDKTLQLKKTQAIFNRYIRTRDKQLPCISCNRHHSGQYHAGHYKTVGANPELRFESDNCHKQCAPCNNHLSGNICNYRINLVNKIGVSGVESIEGPHEPKRYTIDELKELQIHFKKLTEELDNANN